MIDYFKGIYGINLLFRVHGSSLFKGSLVGLVSVLVYLAIELQWNKGRDLNDDDLGHPYGVGVLVGSVSFVIIFRANYGYQRYWEACGALHHFMSKWMDATMHSAVFHLQSKHYDDTRPPNFFDNDKLNVLNLTRDRKRHNVYAPPNEVNEMAPVLADKRLKSVYDCEKEISNHNNFAGNNDASNNIDDLSQEGSSSTHSRRRMHLNFAPPSPHKKSPLPMGVLDGHWDVIPPTPDRAHTDILRRTNKNSENFPSSQHMEENFAARPNGRTPPLFLQELAHLSSLACAVALSTLRNDIEFSESPLDMFVPGAAWPPSDPDRLPKHVRTEFQHRFHFVTILRHWFGMDRLPHWRSKYNASRPLLIYGGVSNSEIRFLQKAKGPHAKAALALGWLKEFIIREHLSGSLGEVHSAIISRLVQFLSDGMMEYHQARKIMYIPFPFPHAQLSAFFTVMMIVAVPFLMDQYTNHLGVGSGITFLTVTCLVGLHEVSRELENPFRNVPNEIPLCTLQAMYNETLATMFSGYNPDSFWDAEMHVGALQAVALSKVYKTQQSSDGDEPGDLVEESAKERILEMPVLSLNGKVEAVGSAQISLKKKRRSVTFSTKVESNSDLAKELQDLLVKQAAEIEELVRVLDEEEKEELIGE